MVTVPYRAVLQAHGAIEPIVGDPPNIGTDGLGPCVGVYFELANTNCFVGHLDTGMMGNTVAQLTALAIATRDGFYYKIRGEFPDETFSEFQNLTLIANDGATTTYALAWGVNEAFKQMVNPDYVFEAPPELGRIGDARRLWNVEQREGNAFLARNRTVRVPRAAVDLDPQGVYGNPGFTFDAALEVSEASGVYT